MLHVVPPRSIPLLYWLLTSLPLHPPSSHFFYRPFTSFFKVSPEEKEGTSFPLPNLFPISKYKYKILFNYKVFDVTIYTTYEYNEIHLNRRQKHVNKLPLTLLNKCISCSKFVTEGGLPVSRMLSGFLTK